MPTKSITPPDSEQEQVRELCKLLEQGTPALVGPGNRRLELPGTVYLLLKDIVQNMQRGRSIMIVHEQEHLTTQKAAGILGVSRPHVVKLLDSREIPSYKTGSHRRVALGDVMAYAKRRDAKRKAVLDELAKESFADGWYDNTSMPEDGEDE